jgi:hypothetical protein
MAGLNRGVSTVVGYVLNVGVATILLSGLLLGGATLVENQEERTVRAELDVVGNRLAADLETADRLHRSANGSVTIRSELPERVAGSPYEVRLVGTASGATIELSTETPAVSRRVPVANATSIRETTVSGGDLVVEATPRGLEVTDG